jgi:ABC-2 type transport system permease protein
VYMVMGLIAGAHLKAGLGGVLVILVLGSLTALGFGALGAAAALRTGSGEAVQGLFPLFFVFIFLSSSNLPRNLLKTGWFHTVATWNPISYLIEAFRSLYIVGWDTTALVRGFAVAGGLTIIALLLVAGALRVRLQRT